MTLEELNRCRVISGEIAHYERELAQLPSVGVAKLDGMPHGATGGDPTANLAMRTAELREMLLQYRTELTIEKMRLERWIYAIQEADPRDAGIREIMAMRFVSCMSWGEIAKEKHMDRATPRKRIMAYLNRQEKSLTFPHEHGV